MKLFEIETQDGKKYKVQRLMGNQPETQEEAMKAFHRSHPNEPIKSCHYLSEESNDETL